MRKLVKKTDDHRVDFKPSPWPTSDQKRELHCVRHHIGRERRNFDCVVKDWEMEFQSEEIRTVYVGGIVAHVVARTILVKAGFTLIQDDGVKLRYV